MVSLCESLPRIQNHLHFLHYLMSYSTCIHKHTTGVRFESNCPLQILGNKSLKIKYLNPSTVFVASGPPAGLLTEDLDPNSVALTVHLVDTVTGAPIYSQTHKVGLLCTVEHLRWSSA